jgi:hypothetical protein
MRAEADEAARFATESATDLPILDELLAVEIFYGSGNGASI